MKDDMVLLKHGGSVTEIKGSTELKRVIGMYLHRKFPVFYLLEDWFMNRYAGVAVLLLMPLLYVFARQVCFVPIAIVFGFLIYRDMSYFLFILPTYNDCICNYHFTDSYLEVQARLLYLELRALVSLKERNNDGIKEAYGTLFFDFDKELAVIEADFEEIVLGYLGYLHSMFNAMDGSKEECLKFSISDYPNKYSSFNHFADSYKQGLA